MSTARDHWFQSNFAGENEIAEAEALDEWLRNGGYHDLPLRQRDRFYGAARQAFDTFNDIRSDRS